jgi:hypothetical protein
MNNLIICVPASSNVNAISPVGPGREPVCVVSMSPLLAWVPFCPDKNKFGTSVVISRLDSNSPCLLFQVSDVARVFVIVVDFSVIVLRCSDSHLILTSSNVV